jgi:Kazal-type serine protease inhibitor domain.
MITKVSIRTLFLLFLAGFPSALSLSSSKKQTLKAAEEPLVADPLIMEPAIRPTVYIPYCDYSHACLDEDRSGTCNQNEDTVVGFTNESTYSIYSNECFACTDPRVQTFYEIHRCSAFSWDDSAPLCDSYVDPVCAIMTNGLQEFTSRCEACSTQGVEWWFRGRCPFQKKKETITCSASQRNNVCPKTYQPVCGVFSYPGQRTFNNACLACSNPNIVNYTSGACFEEYENPPVVKPVPRTPIAMPMTASA